MGDHSLSVSDARRILELYEESYLFFDDIDGYDRRKTLLSMNPGRSSQVMNAWFRDNMPSDELTRVHRRVHSDCKVSFEYPFESAVSVSLKSIEKDAVCRAVTALRNMMPEIVILDLRGTSGSDADAAMELAGSIASGLLCRQRFRRSDRYVVSRKPSMRPYAVFILTDGYTRAAAELAAVSLYVNSERTTVIGSETFGQDIGLETMGGLSAGPSVVFSMASYRWSVRGKGPEALRDRESDRIVRCDPEDTRGCMVAVNRILCERGWMG